VIVLRSAWPLIFPGGGLFLVTGRLWALPYLVEVIVGPLRRQPLPTPGHLSAGMPSLRLVVFDRLVSRVPAPWIDQPESSPWRGLGQCVLPHR